MDPASNFRRHEGLRSAAEEPADEGGGGGEEDVSDECFSGVVRVESVDLCTNVPVAGRTSSSASG